ncbi:MAG: hypothetical protein R6V47_05365 [Candidatus Delongbacteria bacterium]
MKEILKKITKGIKINNEVLKEAKKNKETLDYLTKLDLDSMPGPVKENHIQMIKEAKDALKNIKNDIILKVDGYEDEDIIDYAVKFKDISKFTDIWKDLECIDSIISNPDISLTENIRTKILELRSIRENEFSEFKKDFFEYISDSIKKEYFEEDSIPEKKADEPSTEKRVPRSYHIRKSSKSLKEIKDLIEDFIRINEAIFNKIIFESKTPTLSVSDRILDVNFKQGVGYVINFISEPDTNQGKFYKNLLNVFNEIKEYMYDKYDIVVVPEEGKHIAYLNSFYQNYIFVKEKIDTALTQFKLKNSLLNENFSVRYMIFEKISGKYLIFYKGNKNLSEAVESYFQNQARLGSMHFTLEFIEYTNDLKSLIFDRYEKIVNKVDLSEENNYMEIKKGPGEQDPVLVDITGVKILIDPGQEPEDCDIDILVMSNARLENIDLIPKIMNSNPSAKLFTTDLSYKIARIRWFKELNNTNLIAAGNSEREITRQHIDSINEKVIKITPGGKGYNYKGLINIKFFNSGVIPGSAIVEIRDSAKKTIYINNYSTSDSELITGADLDLGEYDNLIYNKPGCYESTPLAIQDIKEKLSENKQIFIFSDPLGNLQNITAEIYRAGITKPLTAGDASFTIINKELSKLLNYGSSWGDYFRDRELFERSISKLEPFGDEYEFYKKFSMSESGLFILPFEKTEIEMVLKNKLYGNNMIFVPLEKKDEFNKLIQNDQLIPEEYKEGKFICYNYISNDPITGILNDLKKNNSVQNIFTTGGFEEINDSDITKKIDKTSIKAY